MPDAFAHLQADHQRLFEAVNALTGGAGFARGAPKERKAVATRLVMLASRHEAIEELWLWPEVRARLGEGDELAEKAIAQEQLAKRLLDEIEHMSPGNDEFATVIDRISSTIRDHVTYEESTVFPKLRLHMSEREVLDLGERLERSRGAAPTRPHPHTPPTPQALGSLGVVAATMDRARDALTGRGRR